VEGAQGNLGRVGSVPEDVGVAREALLIPPKARSADASQDADLFDHIVRRYGRQVFHLAYRMTGNDADAQDLTQEAFLRVFRALDRVRPGVPLDGWLYRIVTNLFIDSVRRRRGVWVESLDEPASTRTGGEVERVVADPSGNPEGLVVDVQGFAYEEIAQILGLPLGTVKSRLHRARRFLRDRLAPVLRPQGSRAPRGEEGGP
jgi:RNA polymerase sigma-70 factor (ECF subfamily)